MVSLLQCACSSVHILSGHQVLHVPVAIDVLNVLNVVEEEIKLSTGTSNRNSYALYRMTLYFFCRFIYLCNRWRWRLQIW